MRSVNYLAAAMSVWAALSAASPAGANGADDALSEADRQCLACHGTEGLSKTLASGETLALHVDGGAFAKSVHKVLGCAACHANVELKTHPAATSDIRNARQYSIERVEVCRQCHGEVFKFHEGSVHAARVRQGNPVAPVCTGCHGSHSISPKTAYETCVGCHAAALEAHQKWLPNARLHHEVVSCAACHAPAVLRMIDLRLYDRSARAWVSEKVGARFEKLARSIDANGDGLDPEELRKLLAELNRDAGAPGRTLRGRVELRSGVETHMLFEKSGAIRACDNCHRVGSEPFRNVTVSVTGPDGRPLRYPARPEVLTAPLAVISLPEFYAIGGTRSLVLDILFLLALASGVAVPIAHLTMRWLAAKHHNKGS